VSFFLPWPGKVQGGSQIDRLATHIDVFPTLPEACGVDAPSHVQIDGTGLTYDQQWTAWDRCLKEIVSSYWVNFAAHGDPNGANPPRWAAFNGKQISEFGADVPLSASRNLGVSAILDNRTIASARISRRRGRDEGGVRTQSADPSFGDITTPELKAAWQQGRKSSSRTAKRTPQLSVNRIRSGSRGVGTPRNAPKR
jgi:hypothetical protein